MVWKLPFNVAGSSHVCVMTWDTHAFSISNQLIPHICHTHIMWMSWVGMRVWYYMIQDLLMCMLWNGEPNTQLQCVTTMMTSWIVQSVWTPNGSNISSMAWSKCDSWLTHEWMNLQHFQRLRALVRESIGWAVAAYPRGWQTPMAMTLVCHNHWPAHMIQVICLHADVQTIIIRVINSTCINPHHELI